MPDTLKVVRAAIMISTDYGDIPFSMPQPARHHAIIQELRDRGYEGPVQGDRQGFILSDGRFCMRSGAKTAAKRAGQLKGGKTISHLLTSEDLW